MSVTKDVIPAKAGISGPEGANGEAAHSLAGIPASAGMTERLKRAGLIAGGVAGALLVLDLIGFVATVWFGAELLQAAEAAGVAELLPR